MHGANRVAVVLALLALAVFGAAVHRYFHRYFDAGAAGADYSSYLRGPKGTRALYEALEGLPQGSVSRNVRPLDRLPEGDDTTLLIVGVEPWLISDADVRFLTRFAASGGRVVIAVPESLDLLSGDDKDSGDDAAKKGDGDSEKDGEKAEKKAEEKAEEKPEKKNQACDPKKGACAACCDSCESLWGAAFIEGESKGVKEARAVDAVKDALPEALPWRGDARIETGDEHWRTVCTAGGAPVVAERGLGAGSVVLCSDSYLFSNEALAGDRQTRLLSWFLGGARRVIFEESHLGVFESEGVMSLALQYGLGPLLAVFAAVFALFAWRSLTSLDPGPPRDASVREAAGRGSGEALTGLLHRAVPPASLLGLCVREWAATEPPAPSASPGAGRRLEAETVAAAAGPDRVSAYNRICAILKERRER